MRAPLSRASSCSVLLPLVLFLSPAAAFRRSRKYEALASSEGWRVEPKGASKAEEAVCCCRSGLCGSPLDKNETDEYDIEYDIAVGKVLHCCKRKLKANGICGGNLFSNYKTKVADLSRTTSDTYDAGTCKPKLKKVDGCSVAVGAQCFDFSFTTRADVPRDTFLECKCQCKDGVPLGPRASCVAPPQVLHIIGDTHGDENYLFRSLLSTKALTVKNGILTWKENLTDNLEIVILGDVVDRGHLSKQNLITLKRLSEHEKWGPRLRLVMGNHEEMILSGDSRYASGDFDHDKIKKALFAKEGSEDYDLLEWLRSLPVAHFRQGLIMMHGGLERSSMLMMKQQLAGKGLPCETDGPACGAAVVMSLNAASRMYHHVLGIAWRAAGDKVGSIFGLEKPVMKTPESVRGALWFRGYAGIDHGANTRKTCRRVAQVADQLGVKAMVVAHCTHEMITEYCHNQVPVFATDTHTSDCAETGECDYKAHKKAHKHAIDIRKKQVPQSLRVKLGSQDDTPRYSICLSETRSAELHGAVVEVMCCPMLGGVVQKDFCRSELS